MRVVHTPHCPLPSNKFQLTFELITRVFGRASTVVVQYRIKDMSWKATIPNDVCTHSSKRVLVPYKQPPCPLRARLVRLPHCLRAVSWRGGPTNHFTYPRLLVTMSNLDDRIAFRNRLLCPSSIGSVGSRPLWPSTNQRTRGQRARIYLSTL